MLFRSRKQNAARFLQNYIRAKNNEDNYLEELSALSTAVASKTPIKRGRGRPVGSYGPKRRAEIERQEQLEAREQAYQGAVEKIRGAKKTNASSSGFTSIKNAYLHNSTLGYY